LLSLEWIGPDARGERDRDRDGVPDRLDMCPDVPGTIAGGRGCPNPPMVPDAAPPEVPPEVPSETPTVVPPPVVEPAPAPLSAPPAPLPAPPPPPSPPNEDLKKPETP
jgi:hypothetical protein